MFSTIPDARSFCGVPFAGGQRFERLGSPGNQPRSLGAWELHTTAGWLRKYKEQSAEPEVDLTLRILRCAQKFIDHPQVDCRDIV